MKKILLFPALLFATAISAQLNIDTLAFQDFEIVPAAPVWTFTGPVIYNSGFSGAGAEPANSPIGISGSRAWETTSNSGGLVLDFTNTVIPGGYDSVRVRFNLAAMNLISTGGGPDDLDYVLVAYSLDGGTTFANRIRVRGAVNNNSTWPYSATAVAANYYLPATEQVFQPTASGPQTTFGYSTVEIVFPGSITQIAMRITGRSSSSTDTWLVDNLVLTGETNCTTTTSSLSATVCGTYTSPSGDTYSASGTYMDTIPNAIGCDSVITINLTVNNSTVSTLNVNACNSYTSPSGNIITSSGTYMDTITNAAGCDSVITINVQVDSTTHSMIFVDACFSFTMPSGNVVTTSGLFYDTIPNVTGCDSAITYDVLIMTVDTSTSVAGATITANGSNGTYQWIDCNNGNAPIPGETGQSFTPAANGNYAVIVTQGWCTDTSSCVNIQSVGISDELMQNISLYPNPFSETFTITNCPANADVVVTDARGNIVFTVKATGFRVQLDLAGLSSGVYIVEISSGDQSARTKAVKL